MIKCETYRQVTVAKAELLQVGILFASEILLLKKLEIEESS